MLSGVLPRRVWGRPAGRLLRADLPVRAGVRRPGRQRVEPVRCRLCGTPNATYLTCGRPDHGYRGDGGRHLRTKGLCRGCGQPVEPGKARCRSCLDEWNSWQNERNRSRHTARHEAFTAANARRHEAIVGLLADGLLPSEIVRRLQLRSTNTIRNHRRRATREEAARITEGQGRRRAAGSGPKGRTWGAGHLARHLDARERNTRTCVICHRFFLTVRSRYDTRQRRRQTCSDTCAQALAQQRAAVNRPARIKVPCRRCGAIRSLPPSLAVTRVYCSRKCMGLASRERGLYETAPPE